MKPTFTPGPWHVAPRRNEYHSERVFAAGARYIACVGGSDDTVEDQKANAHLIAAAPELLEALEMALEWIDAVPSESAASFPVMPRFDRDWVNELVSNVKGENR